MSEPVLFAIACAGAACELVGCLTFAYEILVGRKTAEGVRLKAQPELVTWLMFTVTISIAFIGQLQEGVGRTIMLTFAVGVGPLLIVAATLVAYRHKLRPLLLAVVNAFRPGSEHRGFRLPLRHASRLACLILSAFGVFMLVSTDDPILAIWFAILADIAAVLPTIYLCVLYPETQGWRLWLLGGIGAALVLVTTPQWSFAYVAIGVYILILDAFNFTMVRYKVGLRLLRRQTEAAQ